MESSTNQLLLVLEVRREADRLQQRHSAEDMPRSQALAQALRLVVAEVAEVTRMIESNRFEGDS